MILSNNNKKMKKKKTRLSLFITKDGLKQQEEQI